MSSWTPLLHSRAPREGRSAPLVTVGPRRARWHYVHFAAHRIVAGDRWVGRTDGDEVCLVLLSGLAIVNWSPGQARAARLGPRRNVFSDYPHAVYLPPKTRFELRAEQTTEIADCRSPTKSRYPAREIRPEDCGLEVRGAAMRLDRSSTFCRPRRPRTGCSCARSSPRAETGRAILRISTIATVRRLKPISKRPITTDSPIPPGMASSASTPPTDGRIAFSPSPMGIW